MHGWDSVQSPADVGRARTQGERLAYWQHHRRKLVCSLTMASWAWWRVAFFSALFGGHPILSNCCQLLHLGLHGVGLAH